MTSNPLPTATLSLGPTGIQVEAGGRVVGHLCHTDEVDQVIDHLASLVGLPEGPSILVDLAIECLKDSERWFPGNSQNIPFLALCLGGEVGEFQNLVKKVERGSLPSPAASDETYYKMVMEITDVFIYLLNLAGALQFDLIKTYREKRTINEGRFGPDKVNLNSGPPTGIGLNNVQPIESMETHNNLVRPVRDNPQA